MRRWSQSSVWLAKVVSSANSNFLIRTLMISVLTFRQTIGWIVCHHVCRSHQWTLRKHRPGGLREREEEYQRGLVQAHSLAWLHSWSRKVGTCCHWLCSRYGIMYVVMLRNVGGQSILCNSLKSSLCLTRSKAFVRLMEKAGIYNDCCCAA